MMLFTTLLPRLKGHPFKRTYVFKPDIRTCSYICKKNQKCSKYSNFSKRGNTQILTNNHIFLHSKLRVISSDFWKNNFSGKFWAKKVQKMSQKLYFSIFFDSLIFFQFLKIWGQNWPKDGHSFFKYRSIYDKKFLFQPNLTLFGYFW